jgi:deoxyribodipyrimidine photo-lyase
MAGGGTTKRVVVWFRGTDLRLHDNVLVSEAAARVQSGAATEVLPVFCFDPRFFSESGRGSGQLKTGAHRAAFLLDSVLDLKDRLRSVGRDLVIAMGAPEAVLPALSAGAAVLAQAEVTSEEAAADAAVSAALQGVGGALELHWGSTMYDREALPFKRDMRDLPDSFTPFKEAAEKHGRVRAPLAAPAAGALPLPAPGAVDPAALAARPARVEDLNAVVPAGAPRLAAPPPEPRAALAFRGGETAALARLQYYLWDTDLVADYFNTRNGMIGGDYSSKLAPWLAHGCLSPRLAAAEVRRYEAARGANKSTYWLLFELTWRDFFKFFARCARAQRRSPCCSPLLSVHSLRLVLLAPAQQARRRHLPGGRHRGRRVPVGGAPRAAGALARGAHRFPSGGRQHARAGRHGVHEQPGAPERGLLPGARPGPRLAAWRRLV